MNTRGRLISGLVTTVMALAGFMTAGTLPAAATASTVQYVALGDSYAAGVGATIVTPSPAGEAVTAIQSCLTIKDELVPWIMLHALARRHTFFPTLRCRSWSWIPGS